MFDVLFIGAGPHCFTTLLRLLEPDADTLVDHATRKTTPKARALQYWHKQRSDPQYRQATTDWLRQHVAVVDPCGSWMGRWQQQFNALQIRHLRSSSAVHPDPLDTYALATYASSQGRLDEAQTLNHIHKTQDFHGPFHTPGSALFEDFCRDLIHRYCLDDIITQDKVVSLTPIFADPTTTTSSSNIASSIASSSVPGKPLPAVDHWLVGLASGQQLAAKKVVVGIGSTNRMRIPPVLSHLQPVLEDGRPDHSNSSEEKSGSSSSSWASQKPQAVDAAEDHEPGSPAAASECSSDGSSFGENSSSGWGSSTAGSAASSSCGCEACEPDASEQQQQQQQPSDQAIDSSSCSDSSDSAAAGITCSHAAGEVPAAGCYPAGRMMHAWQLVQAVAEASSSSSSTCSAGVQQQQQQQPSLEQHGLLLPGESLLIVGGGLTSAHLAQMAASQLRQHAQDTPKSSSSSSSSSGSRGQEAAAAAGSDVDDAAAPVSLLMRGPWRVKQFDVDVPYMGRLRGKRLQEFGQLRSFSQRLALIKQVLQGGSMPPEAAAWLQQLQRERMLSVQQHASLVAAEWDWQEEHWDVYLEDGYVLHPHRLWLATGSVVDVSAEPLMQQLQQQLPIPVVSGLPAIQPSLEWADGSGIYVVGAYAALQLGPGALNLAGAKTASVVIAKQLQKQLGLITPSSSSRGSSRSGSSSSSKSVAMSSGRKGVSSAAAAAGSKGGAGREDVEEQTQPEGTDDAANMTAVCPAGAADAAAAAAAAAAVPITPAATEGDSSSSSSQAVTPCTALKGKDAVFLAGVVTHGGRAMYSKTAHHVYGPYSGPECCGSCWRSRHLAGRARWGAGAAAASGGHCRSSAV